MAAPFRTSRAQGAILVYPRLAQAYSEEDKNLISALAGFGAVAIANAELYGMARAQAHELHEILEISFERARPESSTSSCRLRSSVRGLS